MEIIQSIKRKPKENDYPELSNIDAEIALIGCLLRENKYFEKISDFLLPEHFTNPLNSKLFSVIEKLINQNQLVSPITLKNHLEAPILLCLDQKLFVQVISYYLLGILMLQ